jgi:hypothetical protein
MKINELLDNFKIFTSNEEKDLLDKLETVAYLDSFSERDRHIIENLIRKSLVIKIGSQNPKIVRNDFD